MLTGLLLNIMEVASVDGGRLSSILEAKAAKVSVGSAFRRNCPFFDSNLSSIFDQDLVGEESLVEVRLLLNIRRRSSFGKESVCR